MKKSLLLVFCFAALLAAQTVNNNWTAAENRYWNNSANWSLGHIPLPSEHAIILADGIDRFPMVIYSTACQFLTVGSGTSLSILNGTLTVTDVFYQWGETTLSGSSGLDVWEMRCYDGSLLSSAATNTLELQKNLLAYPGAAINFPGALLVSGVSTSTFTVQSPVSFGQLSLQKSASSLTFGVTSSAPVTVTGSIFVAAGNTFYHGYSGSTFCGGNLQIEAGGSCSFDHGTLVMTGAQGNYITDAGGTSHLNNLTVDKGPDGTLETTNLDLRGSFTLQSGEFYAPPLLSLAGNFSNNAGPGAYYYGDTISFTGNGVTQEVFGQTGFDNVLDNFAAAGRNLVFHDETWIWGTLTVRNNVSFNASSSLAAVDNAPPSAPGTLSFNSDQVYSIQSYASGGTLNCGYASNVDVLDLANDALYGIINVSGGQLEIHQDPAQTFGLEGSLTISGDALVDFQGGTGPFTFGNLCATQLTMSAGVMFIDRGVLISDEAPSCVFNLSGGTIDVTGGWVDQRGNFQPTGGRMRFSGDGDDTVVCPASSWFWELEVLKAISRPEEPPDRWSSLSLNDVTVKAGFLMTEANQVSLAGDLSSLNAAPINILCGTLETNGHHILCSGNLTVSGSGRLLLEAGSQLKMGMAKMFLAEAGGQLLALGTAELPVLVSRLDSGYYNFWIDDGGFISAEHTIFEYMNTTGVSIRGTAVVDVDHALDYCVFREGIPATGSALLTVSNGQSFIVTGAVFPANNGGATYNVKKGTVAPIGSTYFKNWSGEFGGALHEFDLSNRVFWDGDPIPGVTALTLSYIEPPANAVRLEWSYPFAEATYKIYRCATPHGTFVEQASTADKFWDQTDPPGQYFYKVSAVMP